MEFTPLCAAILRRPVCAYAVAKSSGLDLRPEATFRSDERTPGLGRNVCVQAVGGCSSGGMEALGNALSLGRKRSRGSEA